MSNFMYALLQAVGKDQETLGTQQLADAMMTNNDVSIEFMVYSWSRKTLNNDMYLLQTYMKKYSPKQGDLNYRASYVQHVTMLNQEYQRDSTNAQAGQTQMDTQVQACQTQTGQDGQNLSTKAQLAQTMTSVLSTLASVLMQRY
jgi:hypothetical protein